MDLGFYPRSHCKPRDHTQEPAESKCILPVESNSLPIQCTLKGLGQGRQGSRIKGPLVLSHTIIAEDSGLKKSFRVLTSSPVIPRNHIYT